MKFRKLTIENYKSFQFATEIRFPVGEDGRSIFLIGGMNGAGKTSIMEAVNFCLYGAKLDEIFRSINRREKARGNASVSFELVMEMDDLSELVVKRSWSAGVADDPKPKDLTERLVVVRDGKRVSVQNQEIWQDFIRSMIPPGITQFFFFDGEKIQAIAADDHSEVRLKSSLEAALGIQYINRLAADILYIKNEERKGFVEISDEDLDFKQSELKKERSKLTRRQTEREHVQQELAEFRQQLEDARKRFTAAFQAEPETRETMRANEKKRVQAVNRLAQVESEIRGLCEKTLPFAITGRLFEPMRQRIESERDSVGSEAIRENAASLAKRIVRVVEEPEPIYRETLSHEKMVELEIEKLYEKHHGSRERVEFIQECDAIAGVLNQFVVRLRKNKVHLLQEKTFEMYRQLSSRSGLIKDIIIDDKTYELRISDRNGHEIKKSGLSAGEKEVFAVSLLWGLAQTSQLKLPIVIDTPLSRLDSTHRDNIVNNYFPNAGEQVIILSTDTEIDKDYYRILKTRLSGAGILVFDQQRELTTFKEGYFWEN